MQSHADAKEDCTAGLIPLIRPTAPWRLADIEALPGFRLRVLFNDGTEGMIDRKGFLQSPGAGVFAALRDERLFRQARIGLGAGTWPGDLGLAPDAMFRAVKEHSMWIVD